MTGRDRQRLGRALLNVVGDAAVPASRHPESSPRWLTARRAALLAVLAFGLAGLSVIALVVLLFVGAAGDRDEVDRIAEQVAVEVERVRAELEQANADRNAVEAEQSARTRMAVCLVIADLQESDATVGLAVELGCPVVTGDASPPQAGQSPPGSPAPQAPRTGPSAPPAAPPAPARDAPPPPPAEPEPEPSPPPCRTSVLGVCLVP